MTPSQISLLAEKLREQHQPPIDTMRPSEHGAASAIFALSHALDAVAAEVGLDAPTEGRADPHVDDAMLRREALDGALRSASGRGTATQAAAAAEILLAFLRGDAARPSLPGPAGAPAALHEALDRAWSSSEERDGSQIMSDDNDEDVLEQLRNLTDGEVRKATFTLGIVRAFGNVIRSDRIQEAASARAGAK